MKTKILGLVCVVFLIANYSARLRNNGYKFSSRLRSSNCNFDPQIYFPQLSLGDSLSSETKDLLEQICLVNKIVKLKLPSKRRKCTDFLEATFVTNVFENNRKYDKVHSGVAYFKECLAYIQNVLYRNGEEAYLCTLPSMSIALSEKLWLLALRKLRSELICQHYQIPSMAMKYHTTLLPSGLNVGFCINHKAATTTWISYFLKWTNNFKSGRDIHNLAYDNIGVSLSNKQGDDIIRKNDPLMIYSIRHPYERVTSFYRNILMRDMPVYRNLAKRIYMYTRGKSLEEVLSTPDKGRLDASHIKQEARELNVTFPEYVRYYIMKYKYCDGNIDCVFSIDEHTIPVSSKCSACEMEYHLLNEIDSVDEDIELVRKLMVFDGLLKPITGDSSGNLGEASLPDAIEIDHSAVYSFTKLRLNASVRDKIELMKRTREYMQQLTEEEIKQLMLIHKYDFLLYNLNPNDYILS